MNLLYLCSDWILVKTYKLATTCVLEDEQWSFDWIHGLERNYRHSSSCTSCWLRSILVKIRTNLCDILYQIRTILSIIWEITVNVFESFPLYETFLFYSSCYQVQWSVNLSSLRFRVEWNCEIHVMRFSHFLSFPSLPPSFFTTITALNLRYPRLFLMAQLCPVCVYVSTSSPRA